MAIFKDGKLMDIPRLPRDCFEMGASGATEAAVKSAPQPIFEITKVEAPPSGGLYVYYKDMKYPTRGFPYPEALDACWTVKRVLIGQIKSIAKNKIYALSLLWPSNLRRWVEEFNDIGEITLQAHFLKDKLYRDACRELKVFIEVFMQEIGLFKDNRSREMMAKIIATIMEYDTAYLFRIQDLLNETTAEKLCTAPITEIKRLFGVFKERDPFRVPLQGKFKIVAGLFTLVLLIPRVRRAFKAALLAIDFHKVQLDKIDIFTVCRWKSYKFLGMEDADRHKLFYEMNDGIQPKGYIISMD